MNSGEDVPRQYTIAFMDTQFAKNFIERCQMFIRNVLDDEINFNVLYKQQAKDNEGKKFMEFLMKNKANIYNRMFTGKC